jgi:exodeoxyribonuclease-3
MAKIICWNINSIKQRLNILQDLIQNESPDIILLQETKCQDINFPSLELESLGYNLAFWGQKTFNGVAILSKGPIEDVQKGIPEFEDDQTRFIECITTINGTVMRVASVYVPNGQSVGSEKYQYKISFMHALNNYFKKQISYDELFIVAGDYNIAPEEIDVYDPKKLSKSVGFYIDERKVLRESFATGMYDSFRLKYPNTKEYSWWDYRTKSFELDNGMRIDNILISPKACDSLKEAGILKNYRALPKTSDHAPIFIEL